MSNPFHQTDFLRNERGGVLMIFAAILTALVGILALVIDLSRQQIVAKQLQNAVDAAVLAATQQLDGKVSGWRNAKKAAISVLKNTRISETGNALSVDFKLTEGTIDPYETDEAFKGTEGRASERVSVVIERGAYWVPPEGGEPAFMSFEGERTKYSLNSYLLANSAKVSLKYTGLKTTFGRVLGISVLGDLEREAVAVKDKPEAYSAAIAIPACAVLLDTDPYQSRRYQQDEFKAGDQCVREVLITEADPDKSERREGIARSFSYNRLPLISVRDSAVGAVARRSPRHVVKEVTGTICPFAKEQQGQFQNCKAIPLSGTFAVPAGMSGGGSREATVSEVQRVFRNINASTKVKLGESVKTLESKSFLNDTSFERTIAETISNGDRAWMEVFFASDGQGNSNYPLVRRHLPALTDPYVEQRLYFPLKSKEGDVVKNMLMSPQGGAISNPRSETEWRSWAYNYSNPMCHSSRLPYNDPASSRVREVNVMLIAPTDPGTNYCDFRGVFQQTEQNSEPPLTSTKPIVVGFAKAFLFDFNFSSLRDDVVFEPTAQMKDHGVTYPLVENNPAAMELSQIVGKGVIKEFREYCEKHSDWLKNIRDCKQENEQNATCVPRPGRPCPPPRNCFREFPRGQSSEPSGPPEAPESLAQCFSVPNFPWYYQWLRRCQGQGSAAAVQACLEEFTNPGNGGLSPREDLMTEIRKRSDSKHCIPMLKSNATQPNRADSWEVRSLDPQYGCGGIRARLSCDGDPTIPGITPKEQVRAALVN